MLQNLDYISESDLADWVRQHLDSAEHVLSAGYQGKTLLFQQGIHKLVIKTPLGNPLIRPLNLALLRHEYRIYQRLDGLSAVPHCYGMANEQYLVLEYIDGQTMRDVRPVPGSGFYEKLFSAIEQMHQRGVAHFDLKRKENLLVAADDQPVMIDFGVSIYHKGGWHLLNAALFKLAKQFDYNAWIRHKYDKQYEQMSADDQPYYRKTLIETISLKSKRFYKDRIKKCFRSK